MVRIAKVGGHAVIRESSYMKDIKGEFKFPAVIGIIPKSNYKINKKTLTTRIEDKFTLGKLYPKNEEVCYCVIHPKMLYTILYAKTVQRNVNILYVLDIPTSEQPGMGSQMYVKFFWDDILDYKILRDGLGIRVGLNMSNYYATIEAVAVINFADGPNNKRFVKDCQQKYEALGIEPKISMKVNKNYKEPFTEWLLNIIQEKETKGMIKRNPNYKYPYCDEHRLTAKFSRHGTKYSCPKCGKELMTPDNM